MRGDGFIVNLVIVPLLFESNSEWHYVFNLLKENYGSHLCKFRLLCIFIDGNC